MQLLLCGDGVVAATSVPTASAPPAPPLATTAADDVDDDYDLRACPRLLACRQRRRLAVGGGL